MKKVACPMCDEGKVERDDERRDCEHCDGTGLIDEVIVRYAAELDALIAETRRCDPNKLRKFVKARL